MKNQHELFNSDLIRCLRVVVQYGALIYEVGRFRHRKTMHFAIESGRFSHNSAITPPWRKRQVAEGPAPKQGETLVCYGWVTV